VTVRPVVTVVAGILRDERGRLLLARRPAGKHLAGLWEFPGGKLDGGENAAAALKRELNEELGIEVTSCRPWMRLSHDYPDRTVRLVLREVAEWRGRPRGREGQELAWLSAAELGRRAMPAADRPPARLLGLAPRYTISPDPANYSTPSAFLGAWQRQLDRGQRLLQLHAPSLNRRELRRLALDCGRRAQRAGAVWLISGPPELAGECNADGLHLSARQLPGLRSRPVPSSALLGVTCRDGSQLLQAARIGADFACLSPVRPVPDNAGDSADPALGWAGFEELVTCSPIPAMAMGGLRPDDLDQARHRGAFGVAGSTAFWTP